MPSLHAALQRLEKPGGPMLVAAAGVEHATRVTPSHRHAPGQLFGATRGLLTIGTDAGLWVLPAGHAAWIPPHHRHSLRSHGPFAGASVYVAEHACAGLPDVPCALRGNGLLHEAVARAATWTTRAWDASQRRVAELILDEIRAAPRTGSSLPLPVDPRLMRIARALLDDLSDTRDLAAWAAHGAIAARTLTRRFMAETGLSFGDWRQRARLLRALELLAAGASVTSVALDLGYGNVSAFIAMFRRTFGVTPARFFGDAHAGTGFDA